MSNYNYAHFLAGDYNNALRRFMLTYLKGMQLELDAIRETNHETPEGPHLLKLQRDTIDLELRLIEDQVMLLEYFFWSPEILDGLKAEAARK